MKIDHCYRTNQLDGLYRKNKRIKGEEFKQKELKEDKTLTNDSKNTSINMLAAQEQVKSIIRAQKTVTVNEQVTLDKDNKRQEEVNRFFEDMPLQTLKSWQSFMVQRMPIGISNDEWQELMQSAKSYFYEIAENYKIDNNIKEFSSLDYDKVLQLVFKE